MEPKNHLRRSGKGLIAYLGLKSNVRSKKKKKKKASYSIINVSINYITKIIKEYEKLTHVGPDSY